MARRVHTLPFCRFLEKTQCLPAHIANQSGYLAMTRRVLLVISIVVGVLCVIVHIVNTVGPSFQTLPPSFEIIRYNKESKRIDRRSIGVADPCFAVFRKWFDQNRTTGGWKMSMHTYAPGILISADGISVKFRKSDVVVNERGRLFPNHWAQYVRPRTESDDEIVESLLQQLKEE